MLRIQRSTNGKVVFKLSGRIDTENVSELKTLVETESNDGRIVLDLKDLTLVDRDGVIFLGHCEANDITLKHCPAYIREWIERERDGS
jgi:anti-anti-sigma regulatory factor